MVAATPTPRRRLIGLAALGLALITAVSGCAPAATNSGGDSGGSAKAGATPEVMAEVNAWLSEATNPPSWPVPGSVIPKPADLKGKTVSIIPFSDQIPLMHGSAAAMQEALAALGAEGKICDGGANPSQIATCLKAAGDQNVGAAVMLYMEYEPMANAIDALVAQGVPVLIAGVIPSDKRPAGNGLAYADNTEAINAGYENVAKQALAVQDGNTTMLWARLTDSSLTTGFSDAGIAKFKELCPACKISTIDFSTSSLDKLPTAISAALAANPDTNVAFIPPDSFVPAALPGIQSAGFADKLKLVGNGADAAGLQRVAAGTQASTAASNVEFEGWQFTHALMLFLSGQEVPKFTVDAARTFLPETVESLGKIKPEDYFSSAWFGDDSFKEGFLTAWGAK